MVEMLEPSHQLGDPIPKFRPLPGGVVGGDRRPMKRTGDGVQVRSAAASEHGGQQGDRLGLVVDLAVAFLDRARHRNRPGLR